MSRRFSSRSIRSLQGVDARLVIMATEALAESSIDFVVIEGLRTVERQRELLNSGASQTMNSKHITGHAIDVAAWVGGQIRWDWPLYAQISEAFKASAARHGFPLTWGGDWRSFKDGPHYQVTP